MSVWCTHAPAVSYDTSVFCVQLRSNQDIDLTTLVRTFSLKELEGGLEVRAEAK